MCREYKESVELPTHTHTHTHTRTALAPLNIGTQHLTEPAEWYTRFPQHCSELPFSSATSWQDSRFA